MEVFLPNIIADSATKIFFIKILTGRKELRLFDKAQIGFRFKKKLRI
jgi:hypothetical protein